MPIIANSRCLVSSERGTERVSLAVKVWNGIVSLDEIIDAVGAFPETALVLPAEAGPSALWFHSLRE
jgi:hypothetical protein